MFGEHAFQVNISEHKHVYNNNDDDDDDDDIIVVPKQLGEQVAVKLPAFESYRVSIVY